MIVHDKNSWKLKHFLELKLQRAVQTALWQMLISIKTQPYLVFYVRPNFLIAIHCDEPKQNQSFWRNRGFVLNCHKCWVWGETTCMEGFLAGLNFVSYVEWIFLFTWTSYTYSVEKFQLSAITYFLSFTGLVSFIRIYPWIRGTVFLFIGIVQKSEFIPQNRNWITCKVAI